MSLLPFSPGGTVSIAADDTTANVALAKSGVAQQIMIKGSPTGDVAFVKFGTSTVEAAVTDFPVLPGELPRVISVGPDVTHVAAICASTETQTLYFTSGIGA